MGRFRFWWLSVVLVACVGDDPPINNTSTNPADGGTGNTNDGGVTPTTPELVLESAARPIAQAATADVKATIQRNGRATALTLHISGLPAGVTAPDVAIPPADSAGTLKLTASGEAVIGTSSNAVVELLDGTSKITEKPLAVTITGKAGTLDGTWGVGGIAERDTTAFGGDASTTAPVTAIAVYPATSPHAGKIVIGGKIAQGTSQKLFVARLDASGAKDPTFTGGGIFDPGPVHTPANEDARVVRIAIDSQDRVVLLGNRVASGAGFCMVEVARFDAAGALDGTFTKYSSLLGTSGCGDAQDMAVLPNDSVVVLATWNTFVEGGVRRTTYLQPIDASGAPGTRQTVAVNPDTSTQMFRIRVDAQGRYVLGGSVCTGNIEPDTFACQAAITRVSSATGVDKTFGTNGVSVFSFGGTGKAGLWQGFFGLTLAPDGSTVVAGGNDGLVTSASARTNPDGTPMATFGTSAQLKRQLLEGATREVLHEALFDADGRIVVVGYAANSTETFLVHSRMQSNGEPDMAYGDASITKVTTRVLTYGPRAAITLDGRLVIAGNKTTSGVAVWRFWL